MINNFPKQITKISCRWLKNAFLAAPSLSSRTFNQLTIFFPPGNFSSRRPNLSSRRPTGDLHASLLPSSFVSPLFRNNTSFSIGVFTSWSCPKMHIMEWRDPMVVLKFMFPKGASMNPKYKLREAVDSLYRQTHVNPQAYARLVLDCVRLSDAHQAKRLQSHMEEHLYEPATTFIHNRLLHVYANSGMLLDAQNLFDKLPQRDIYTYNAMLKAYSKTGSVDDLHRLLKNMPCHDSVSYNTVIAGLASRGCPREALEVFIKMQKEGFEVTGHTYVSVLNACSRVLDLGCGKQVHGKIVASDRLDEAKKLFAEVDEKDAISWTTMIVGHVQNGKEEDALVLFSEMLMEHGIYNVFHPMVNYTVAHHNHGNTMLLTPVEFII
ncbi:hypothetical protein L6452_02613 [Arctium lappa]|uniref:Uncharacterized protein n=1 Tax=Arctium lappa TaxID=4217 RepID=A0ACB9FJJ4_ARCLA|nr:hypothetical protein L6452_02613 [Arctium lappa]